MPYAHRLGDKCTGEPCFPPTTLAQASPDTLVNNLGAARVGDLYIPHFCALVTHPSPLGKGSSTVFINNLPACRMGDNVACNPINFALEASFDVIIGG